ncbi:hypothetical protein GCM10025876_30100 [Demequina litorisediminis]|uniref:Secreted protein n=1 Tax=Demequina litorisediminis TaxID=1849022 RepID=A0ABQ6IGF3_9MICO|nr:hypothetical protein GCM10025876_30100 [Demequina litorisediminis]
MPSTVGIAAVACAARRWPEAEPSLASLRLDRHVARTATGDQADEQVPLQVLVDLETLEVELLVDEALEVVQVKVGLGVGGEGAHELERLSEPGSASMASFHSLFRDVLGGVALVHRVHVQREGRRQAAQQHHDGGRLGLAADVLQHQVDVLAGGHFAVAGHVPRCRQHHRASQRVGEGAHVLDRGRERLLVEANLRVGEVAIVDEEKGGAVLTDQAPTRRCAHR